jgi:hypothetical protein
MMRLSSWTETSMDDSSPYTDIERPRYSFPGFGSTGHCYLKARIRPDSIVVLCAQLIGYHGTSVTNGLEAIRDSLITDLKASGELAQFKGVASPRQPPYPYNVYERLAWIEHYPAGTSLGGDETFAYVRFHGDSPAWSYLKVRQIADLCHVPESFFKVSPGELVYAGT